MKIFIFTAEFMAAKKADTTQGIKLDAKEVGKESKAKQV